MSVFGGIVNELIFVPIILNGILYLFYEKSLCDMHNLKAEEYYDILNNEIYENIFHFLLFEIMKKNSNALMFFNITRKLE